MNKHSSLCSTLVLGLALLGTLVAQPAQAQEEYAVVGVVADSAGAKLNGAMVVALSLPDSVLKKFSLTDGDGSFSLTRLIAGDYVLQVSMVGRQTVRQDITITDGNVDAGTIEVDVLAVEMEALVVSVDHVPFVNRRDTMDYNALAFETRPQATVEDLLARLPGVEVAEDGSITAQGEEVQNVLVEGKEFFGSDPTIATRNLPADAVERVQIYDKQSDMAEFTGIADGQEERTINLDLKEGAENSYFGNVVGSLGGGSEAVTIASTTGGRGLRYNESLSINKFSPTTQLAVLGGINNVNQPGFNIGGGGSFAGGGGRAGGGTIRVGGGGDNGFTESLAVGLNASHDFAEDDWLRTSYFFTELDNARNSETLQQLLLGSQVSSLSDQTSNQAAYQLSHRFNANAQKTFSAGHDMRFRGNLNLGSSESTSFGTQSTTAADGRPLNTAVTDYVGDNSSLSGNARLTWRKRINEDGRSLVAESRANISDPEEFTNLTSTIGSYGRGDVLTNQEIAQEQSQTGRTFGYSQRLALTEPLGGGKVLELFGQHSATEEDRDESVYDIVAGAPVFNAAQSSAFERTYSYLRGGFRLSRNVDDKRFVLGLEVQGSNLDGKILDRDETITNGYTHVLPSLDYRVQFDQGKNLTVRYTTSTREPSLTQLQPYSNNTNPLNIYSGNPDLTPEYTHRLRGDFRSFDQFTFLNFFTFGQISYTNDQIVTARTVDEDAVQTRTPINAANGWGANGGATLGTPIRRIGAEINLTYNANYSTGTEFVNGVENISNILRHTVDVSMENRDKTVFEVRAGGRFTFNNVDYSINQEFAQEYLNRTLYANGSLYFGTGWTLESRLNYEFFDQEIFGPGQNVAALQASLSRFVMNDRAQIKLVALDLLNQNQGVSLTNTSAYIQEERVQTLGRYVMLSMSWQLGPQRGGTSGRFSGARRGGR